MFFNICMCAVVKVGKSCYILRRAFIYSSIRGSWIIFFVHFNTRSNFNPSMKSPCISQDHVLIFRSLFFILKHCQQSRFLSAWFLKYTLLFSFRFFNNITTVLLVGIMTEVSFKFVSCDRSGRHLFYAMGVDLFFLFFVIAIKKIIDIFVVWCFRLPVMSSII